MKTPKVICDETVEGEFDYSPTQLYTVEKWVITAPEEIEAGTIKLRNLLNDTVQEFQIWQGDPDLTFYYVCVPNEDCSDTEEDDEYDVINIEDLGIHVFKFTALPDESRICAATHYANEKLRQGRPYTVQRAYRELRKSEIDLFDINGAPTWIPREIKEKLEARVDV